MGFTNSAGPDRDKPSAAGDGILEEPVQLTPLDHRDFHGTVTTAMRTSTRTRFVDVKSMCTVTL